MKVLPSALPLFLPALVLGAQEVRIEGSLLDQDGRPMPLAHARLLDKAGRELAQVAAAPDGRFSLQTPAPRGRYKLAFSGMYHRERLVDLPLMGPRTIKVRAQLAPASLHPDLSHAEVVLVVDGKLGASFPMKRLGEALVAEITAPGTEVAYQIKGVDSRGNTINGTSGSKPTFDGEGDYFTHVDLKDGKATITFRPELYPRSTKGSEIVFSPEDADLQALARIDLEVSALNEKLQAAFRETQRSGAQIQVGSGTFEPECGGWKAALATEQRPMVREALFGALLQFGHANPEEVVKEFPPTSEFWSSKPHFIAIGLQTFNGPLREALLKGLLDHPDPGVAARVVQAELMPLIFGGKLPEAEAALARLDALKPGLPTLVQMKGQIEAMKRTASGQKVPHFAIASLEDPKVVYTPETFKGRYLLIDFWATWCGPCRAEMPALHKAYARFKGRGLEILSLSFDQNAADIAPFRAVAATAMPWKHAFVEGGFNSDLGRSFGVRGIPRPILVGPNGRIVASEGELRGVKLEETLAKHLGGGQ